jgi:hypothetical protein
VGGSPIPHMKGVALGHRQRAEGAQGLCTVRCAVEEKNPQPLRSWRTRVALIAEPIALNFWRRNLHHQTPRARRPEPKRLVERAADCLQMGAGARAHA